MRAECREIEENPPKEGEKGKSMLPYSWAVVLECLRFIPQAGFGGPHHSEEDIRVGQYRIPAGTDIFPDLLGILRSERHWEKPDTFDPTRFLGGYSKTIWI